MEKLKIVRSHSHKVLMMHRISEECDMETDVIIVGSGFSGLSAAIEAYDAGANVIILEKMHTLGGNSILAGGGVNAVDPKLQIPQGIEDSADLHFRHTLEGGEYLGDPEKVQFIVDNALEMCVKWLENIGVSWPDEVVQGYGALWRRTHIPAKYGKYQRGSAIVHAELYQVRKRGIRVLLQHKVTEIFREKILEGNVLGVKAETDQKELFLKARKAVVLASGGFAANVEMVMDRDRRLINTPTTNHSGADGECIKMAQDIGAEVVGMDYIQCVPMTVKPPVIGYFFIICGKEIRDYSNINSCVFVNNEGKRFVKEDGRRDEISFAAFAQKPFKAVSEVEGKTIEELEKNLRIPRGNLVKTIQKYNCYCDSRYDPDFGKASYLLIPFNTPPFRAETKAPSRHHTMGGLKVKGTTGRVVDRWGKVIPHFYAVGEVTGGFHGSNRLGHNSTPECIIYGRVVGKLAASESSLK